MSSEYENQKAYRLAQVLRAVREHPKEFAALDTPSEMRGAQYIAPSRKAGSHAWSQLAEFMPEPGETENAVYAGFKDGFSFSTADEIGAGVDAIGAWFDDRDAGAVYDAELKRSRAEAAYLEQQHPIAYAGGNVVGAIAQPATYVPFGWAARTASVASNAGRTVPMLVKAAQLAGGGAVDGAIHGFNGGEGGFEDRLENAGEGALWGAGMAAAVPPARKVLAKGGEALYDAMKPFLEKAAKVSGPALDKFVEPSSRRIPNRPQDCWNRRDK
jgi:hypothetical protein